MKGVLAPVEQAAKRILRFHGQLAETRDNLVGYVMELGYDTGVVVTNDYYKIRAGGLSKNSFLLIHPGSLKNLIRPDDGVYPGADSNDTLFDQLAKMGVRDQPPHLILARVLEPAATPLSQDVAKTYFEMHKSHMPEIDVFTRSELQWGAMRISVLGTFYDSDKNAVLFGGDIQNFLSPHLYSVHVPPPEMLEELVNVFVDAKTKQRIGAIRLTESILNPPPREIAVHVSPSDFIGSRTALFGKTRMGKSNTVKVIAQMIMESGAKVGQVIFDLNGEYAYRNEQDKTSIYELYERQCERYTLRPNPETGVQVLKANFYRDLKLGHQILTDLYQQQEGRPPDYIKPFFEWEPLTDEELKTLKTEDWGAYTRHLRQRSIYFCMLRKAGFEADKGERVDLHLNQEVRTFVAAAMKDDEDGEVPDLEGRLGLADAETAFSTLWKVYKPEEKPFKSKGGEYLDETAKSMLTILTGRNEKGSSFSGTRKFVPYADYHSAKANNLLRSIVEAVKAAKTVIIDLSNAPQELARFFADLISRALFNEQMDRFTHNRLGDQHVQFYFEEAHNLFPRDDRDLTTIYNRLAKEGAKLNIGIIYSTQSIESLSPDLLKNTENFFIAHLNDEREIKTLTRFQEFQDVGADVQRTKTRGFVRMITKSHRFALPVQIRKFGPEA